MPVYIHDIVTSNPETTVDQDYVRDVVKEKIGYDRKSQSIIHRMYTQSGIQKRHTVLEDAYSESESTFVNRAFGSNKSPGTAERNNLYKKEATKLFLNVGAELLAKNPTFKKEDITHVITISCTGFYAPGPDFEVVRGLGLNPTTERFHIGFMGCYAAFQGLKMAKSFCEADPNAAVMIISCELCSLHFQNKTDIDSLIATSVFADGAAGVLVSSKKPEHGFELNAFASSLAYEGEQDMAWTIGDHGFNMVLSTYVPDIISSNLENVVSPIFEKLSISKEDITIWAVHPGGRAIVDKVEQSMNLKACQVESSRKILANFGNMSSATVLFVLKDVLETEFENGTKVLPMAFGPGLTIETGILSVVNS